MGSLGLQPRPPPMEHQPVLTNREIATLILFGALAAWALMSSNRSAVLRSMGSVLAMLTRPKLSVPTVLYIALITGLLVPASWLGLWESDLVGATVRWMLFSGLGLLFSLNAAIDEPDFFKRAFLRMLAVVAVVEFLATLSSFPLWAEILGQLLAAMAALIAVQAGTHPRAARTANGYLIFFGLAAIAWGVWQVVDGWSLIDRGLLFREFLLPIWLTPFALLFVFGFAVVGAYENAFVRMSLGDGNHSSVGRQRLALILRSGLSLSHLRLVAGREMWIGNADGFRETWSRIGEAKQASRERVLAAEEAARRLVENAGRTGTDGDGRQLDRREFSETQEALRSVAFAQMGWWNRDHRYREDLLEMLEPTFGLDGLQEPSGIAMYVAPDGHSWYAERQTITGHWFAIGAAGPTPDQWLLDGPERPSGFPAEPEWDHWGGGSPSLNWD